MLRRRLEWLNSMIGGRVDGRPIAVTRIMLGGALILVSLEQSLALFRIAGGALAYPYFSWIPTPSPQLATAVLTIGWIAGTCLVLGLLPELMAVTGAVACLLALLWDQQLYSSHGTLLTILLVFLAFAKSDQRWALSSRRHKDALGVPWWPQFLMMTQVSVVYFYAGLSKLQPTFLSGRSLSGLMWMDLPIGGYALLAWATVVTELGLTVALWIRRTRRVAVALGLTLHGSIVTLLSGENLWLVAFALATMSTYSLFLTRPLASLDTITSDRRAAQSPSGAA